jgi:hypothetical protein
VEDFVLQYLTGTRSWQYDSQRRFVSEMDLSETAVEEELIYTLIAEYSETPLYGGKISKVIPDLMIAQVTEAEQLDKMAKEHS